MHIGEAARTSAAEIWSHKLRSALTLVGIVLGTTALVVLIPTVFVVAATAAGIPGRIAARTKPAVVLRSE